MLLTIILSLVGAILITVAAFAFDTNEDENPIKVALFFLGLIMTLVCICIIAERGGYDKGMKDGFETGVMMQMRNEAEIRYTVTPDGEVMDTIVNVPEKLLR